MDKNLKQAYFQIIEGGIQEYAFFKENYDPTVPEFQLKSTISFQFTQDTNVLTSNAGITINQNGIPVLKCTISFDYSLLEETIREFTKCKQIVIPRDILIYFGSNALGALRGAIMAKLETTTFRFILPPVNLGDIIKESLTIERDTN